MKTKLLIISTLLLLLSIGIVVASDIDSQLKTPSEYGNIENGCATYRTYPQRAIYVEKVFGNIKEDYLTNRSQFQYEVNPVGNNIYYMKDGTLNFYGYFEVVEVNGVQYMISVLQESKLSPSEEKELLDHIKEFNKINNLTPIAV